ncbi:MAG: adenosylmethionine--8-amino-7-oxononanoate transaminase [Cyclobacteriaceae bacterium]
MTDLQILDRTNIWHPFTPLQGADDPLVITSAEGVYLKTADGRQIIDAISSWWVNLHGHSHPSIAKAIADQATKLEHVIFAGFTHEPAIKLSRNLLSILPPQITKIFFSDNGSTAVEVALKMTFQYWFNKQIKKDKVIAIQGAYHGDTFGAMSVADRSLFTEPFFPYLFETTFIDFPGPENEEEVLRQFKQLVEQKNVGAFIFEPLVQGAAGMRMYSAPLLDSLISHAREYEVICIADEVFTGFGRTGKNFAVDYLENKPDIIAVSKGITGGFMPLGVTACSAKIIAAFDSPDLTKTFFHGHSYTANPLACAAANASFELLKDEHCQKRITDISEKQKQFAESLSGNKKTAAVRSLGTLLAIELINDEKTGYENSLRKKIYRYFLDKNILLRPLGNVFYLLPPYVITDKQLAYIYKTIEDFLSIDPPIR